MINLYMVQPDIVLGQSKKSVYLPYATGLLTAAAMSDEYVAQNYHLGGFIFMREDIDKAAASLENPGVVGFSNYCWNTNYNKLLAAKVKELYPNCVTVFGGHNVPPDTSMLKENPCIDFLIYGEGEHPFTELLHALAAGADVSSVCNIAYRDGEGRAVKTPESAPGELDTPSPYLTGIFDELMASHPELHFDAILETSRGCPNRCAYCDWGLLKSKTRIFPLDRVLDEIKWMSEHKIGFVWGADANFGMFERDEVIADALVKAKETTGYPERMRTNYSKNNFDRVLSIVRKFKECGFDKLGATLSFQSLSPTVLENIGRKNMSIEFFEELLLKYRKEHLKAYSDLIVGLPGETYRSFIEGFAKLLELGQHYFFEVFECMLLPNSIMATPEYMRRFSIKTVDFEIIRVHSSAYSFDIPEYARIIVETDTMPRADWVRAMMFYNLISALHCDGLLRVFAIYLFYEMGVSYNEFYDGLIDFFNSNRDMRSYKFYSDILEIVENRSYGKPYTKKTFPPCGELVWHDYEYLSMSYLEEADIFYGEMLPYLRSFGIPDDIFSDLLAYQRAIMRSPYSLSETVELSYDLHPYFTAVYESEREPLQKRRNRLIMTDTDHYSEWKDFGKYVVWFGPMGFVAYKEKVEEEYLD